MIILKLKDCDATCWHGKASTIYSVRRGIISQSSIAIVLYTPYNIIELYEDMCMHAHHLAIDVVKFSYSYGLHDLHYTE